MIMQGSQLVWSKSVPAIFETFEEVTCQLVDESGNYSSQYGEYQIRVSNDGHRKSNKMAVVVHNMACTDCHVENDEMVCKRKVGVNYITYKMIFIYIGTNFIRVILK